MNNDPVLTKALGTMLSGARGITEWAVDKGLVDPEKLRLTVAAFRGEAKRLVDSGMSERQAAKALGVPRSTLKSRLVENGPKTGRKSTTKAERRAEREQELASKQLDLPTKKYGVILADPEWRFEPYSRETGMDRAADNHYPTSTTNIIADRNVEAIAADDAVLFLWATVPMLRDAIFVMECWGFDYKSHIIWDKIHIGTGYWFRNRHELLLVGTRGNIPAPAMGEQFASLITIARKEHSAKPEQFIELIEQYFPTLPKIELNRRGSARLGWDAWGNEFQQAAE
jgi:N6-adenosine-specific RNA methylase IME4